MKLKIKFFLVLMVCLGFLLACPNNNSDINSNIENESTVKITVTGDKKFVKLYPSPNDTFEVKAGTKWGEVKSIAETKVRYNAGYEFSDWKINSAEGKVLTSDYHLTTDTVVFAVAKAIPKYEVKIIQPTANGTIESNKKLPDDNKVLRDTEIVFRLNTDIAKYELDKWTITGCEIIQGDPNKDLAITVKIIGAANISLTIKDRVTPIDPEPYKANLIPVIETEPVIIEGKKLSYPIPKTARSIFVSGRNVELSPYSIAESEVTYILWKTIYDWAITKGYTFANVGKNGSSGAGELGEPVIAISWRDAIVWCNAYTEKELGLGECVYRFNDEIVKDATKFTGEDKIGNYDVDNVACDLSKKGYRLPTEAEWVYAARYTTDESNADKYGSLLLTKVNSVSGALVNYTDETTSKEYGWFKNNSNGITHPVKTKKPNALNLYDMSGNVFEFCFDWLHTDPKINDTQYLVGGNIKNPFGATKDQSSKDSNNYGSAKRIIRSSSYRVMTTATIIGHTGKVTPDGASFYIGFRLAQTK